MAEDFSAVFDFFSSTFGVPSQWFEGTNLIFYFVIPLIAMVFFWYFFLNNKMRFLKSSAANWIIAAMLALMSTAVFNFTGHPTGTIIIGVVGALFFQGGLSLVRVIIAVTLAVLIGIGFPMLINYVSNQV